MKKNKNTTRNKILAGLIILATIVSSCSEPSNPKQRAYYRITFPEKTYQEYSTDCPYSFQYPTYAKINVYDNNETEPCWLNINFPTYNADIHITYKEVKDNNLHLLFEDSHTLVYKHVSKADAIDDRIFINDSLKIYAKLFNIAGNAATPLQFHITDSANHFIRGSLYFNITPNKDSLAPAIEFLKKDVQHLIETMEWK